MARPHLVKLPTCARKRLKEFLAPKKQQKGDPWGPHSISSDQLRSAAFPIRFQPQSHEGYMRKGAVESPSMVKESHWGWGMCGRAGHAWGCWKANEWSCNSEAWFAVQTPRCYDYQSCVISAYMDSTQGVESAQEREVCCRRQRRKRRVFRPMVQVYSFKSNHQVQWIWVSGLCVCRPVYRTSLLEDTKSELMWIVPDSLPQISRQFDWWRAFSSPVPKNWIEGSTLSNAQITVEDGM